MTKIEWTDDTWNPVVGCKRVSAGCDNCYAAKMAVRLEAMGRPEYKGFANKKHFTGAVRCLDDRIEKPLHWRKPRMVFVNSMSDLFHPSVPFEFIDQVFAVMALCPQHTFQVLTKRPARMAQYTSDRGDVLEAMSKIDESAPECMASMPIPNVWIGASVEDQPSADERIPHLLKCPAAIRFLSVEPMLGPVDLDFERFYYEQYSPAALTDSGWNPNAVSRQAIDWVIFGGESGPGARPCNVDWIRSGLKQCKDAGVPAFVKQLGANAVLGGLIAIGASVELVPGDPSFGRLVGAALKADLDHPKGGDPSEWPEDLRVREWPKVDIPA